MGARALWPIAGATGQLVDAIEGDSGGRLTLPAAEARAIGLAEGQVVRALVPRRGVRELVVRAVDDGTPRSTVDVQLAPLRHLFALRGYARTITDGAVSLTFDPFVGTAAEFLTRTFVPNLAADGLAWVSLGTFEDTARRSWPAVSVQTRGQLLTTVERVTGYEIVLRALANDAGYAVDLVAQHNATRAPWLLDADRADVAIQRTRALVESATAALGVGDDSAPMGEVAWVGGAPIGAGPWWIPLADPTGGPPPIREDGQLVGTLLALPDGTTLAVTGTRASDSAVRVDSLGTYATGQRVAFWESAGGRPVSMLTSPSALAASRGLIVAQVRARGGRQERNLVRNGAFETADLSDWAAIGAPAGVVIPRSELGVTTTARVATARPAGTGVGTGLAVNNAPPGYWFRRGHQLEAAGVTLEVNGAAIPTTTGALTIPVAAPGLPASYANGTPFQLVRRDVHTLTLDGEQSALAPVLRFRDSNTDGLVFGTTGSLVSGSYTSTSGANVGFLQYANGLAGVALVSVRTDQSVDRGALTWPTYAADVYQLLGEQLLFTFGESTGTVTFVGTTGGVPVVGTRLRYLGSNGRFQLLRVTAVAPGSLAVVRDDGGPLVIRGPGIMEACNVLLADGAVFTLTAVRETRTLLLAGAQAAGTTAVPFQAQPNLATRNWLNTDTVSLPRTLTGTLDLSAVGDPQPVFDYDPELDQDVLVGWTLTATFVPATSSLDDIAPADYPPGGVVLQAGTSGAWRLDSLVGTTATFFQGFPGNSVPLPVGVVSTTWTRTDTYALGGAASWGTNGRAVLPLAAAIPAGRSYARGLPVSSNWVAGFLRLHAQVNAGALSLEVFGFDGFLLSPFDPASNNRGALYRVTASGSTLPIPGDTLDCAADVQVGAGGTATVTLRAPNTNALAVDTVLTVRVPQLLADTDPRAGAVLRLLFAPGSGTPANSVAAYQSTAELVRVPAGGERVVTARAWFAITPDTLGAGQAPVIALVDPDSNTVLAWGNIGTASVTYNARPTELPLIAQTTLTSSRRVALRVYGGSSSVFSRWHVLKAALLYVGAATDVPYTREALSLNTWHRCQDVLERRAAAARYSVRALELGALSGAGDPPVVGQPALIRAPALGVTVRQRITRLVWRWPGAELVEVDLGPLAPKLTDVDVTL